MAKPPTLDLDIEVTRGASYDLGRQPLMPTSPTAGRSSSAAARKKPRLDPLGCFWPLWSETGDVEDVISVLFFVI